MHTQPGRIAQTTLAIAAFALACRAQQPRQQDPAEATLGRACGIAVADGELTAQARTYRARFLPSGLEFTPALGSTTQRSHPVQLALVSLGREGAVPLALDREVLPQRETDGGDTVAYQRHRDVVERWIARPEGIELTLTFARTLPGHGDLVARYALGSDLPRAACVDGDGAKLVGPAGGVRIGGVVGIDARGERASGRVVLDGRTLELRLPAAFVDRAAFPLVLDPLISTEIAVSLGSDESAPEVAFDPVSGNWLVVFERHLSAADSDVLAQRVASNGTLVGAPILIDSATRASSKPVVASVRANGRFLVVWRDGAPFGEQNLRMRWVSGAGATSVTIAMANTDAVRFARVAGNATTTGTDALLAWSLGDTSPGLRLTPVSVAGSLPLTGTTNVVVTSWVRGLALSATGGTDGRIGVVYTSQTLATTPLRALIADHSGAMLGAPVELESHSALPDLAIDGDGTRFLAAWGSGTVLGRLLRWDVPGTSLGVDSPTLAIASDANVDEREPAVVWLGPKYLVAWTRDAGGFQADIGAQALDVATGMPCEVALQLGRASHYDFAPRGASRASVGLTANDDALIVYESAPLVPPFAGEIRAQRVEAFGSGTFTNQGGGCGANLLPIPVGPFVVGNTDFELRVANVFGATAAAVNVNLPGVVPITCGTCQITPPLVSLSATFSGSHAVAPLPIPCDMRLFGVRLELQWLVLGLGQTPCPFAPGVSFADRQHATIGY